MDSIATISSSQSSFVCFSGSIVNSGPTLFRYATIIGDTEEAEAVLTAFSASSTEYPRSQRSLISPLSFARTLLLSFVDISAVFFALFNKTIGSFIAFGANFAGNRDSGMLMTSQSKALS